MRQTTRSAPPRAVDSRSKDRARCRTRGIGTTPEHMTCEFAGGCRERLEEYWEVEGRMLCERHAGVAQDVGAGGSGDEEEGGDGEKWSRRRTKC